MNTAYATMTINGKDKTPGIAIPSRFQPLVIDMAKVAEISEHAQKITDDLSPLHYEPLVFDPAKIQEAQATANWIRHTVFGKK